MTLRNVEISSKGKTIQVPGVEIDDVTLVAIRRFPRVVAVKDEAFVEGLAVRDPAKFIDRVRGSGLPADVLTFALPLDAPPASNAPYFFEIDNAAVVKTSDFDEWWTGLPQATRKNCRRADRRGVRVGLTSLDERLASGIKQLYDEAPTRQGRRFWHYGKSLKTIFRENSTYLDRSEFIGCYRDDELIGFMKLVYVGRVARIMQILASTAHYDKRPMNAMIAKAVETCASRGVRYLVYGKFQYGNKRDSQMIEFKSRNGFQRLDFPRYVVPLTPLGRIALACRLHRDLLDVLPGWLIHAALRLRDRMNAPATPVPAETGVSRRGTDD